MRAASSLKYDCMAGLSTRCVRVAHTPLHAQVGLEVGYLDMGWMLPAAAGAPPASSPPSIADLERSTVGMLLHSAGYPDNQRNGTMWYTNCSALQWGYVLYGQPMLFHGCETRGGYSGAPLWVRWRTPQGWRRQVVGMHMGAVTSSKGGPRPMAVAFHAGTYDWLRGVIGKHAC